MNTAPRMLIEQVLPQVIGQRAPLRAAFYWMARQAGLCRSTTTDYFSLLPERLRRAEAFYDLLSEKWRYEFGEPYSLAGNRRLLGPHVWPLVQNLVVVVDNAFRVLRHRALGRYFVRLGEARRHEEVLVEFLPTPHFPKGASTLFEERTGVGNKDVDWTVHLRPFPPILFEVKRRIYDLLHLAERTMGGVRRPNGSAPQPIHSTAPFFRSVETKFRAASPDQRLQGVWVVSSLKQEADELERAFLALDDAKVHFAVLGGWSNGVRLLTRRERDREPLLTSLGLVEAPEGHSFRRE